MIGIGGIGVFYAKVVHNKRKDDVLFVVFPEAVCQGDRMATVRGHAFDELVVRNFTGLGKAIHAATDLNSEKSIVNQVADVVFVKDDVGTMWTGIRI